MQVVSDRWNMRLRLCSLNGRFANFELLKRTGNERNGVWLDIEGFTEGGNYHGREPIVPARVIECDLILLEELRDTTHEL